jgi:steroid 5-alpha reductase family enzyme
MIKRVIKSLLIILVIASLGAGIALAGSYNGATVFDGFPLFALCVIMAFAINWIAFIPAFIFQTEKFFDLTGSITYISVVLVGFLLSPLYDARTFIVMVLVFIWAARLGTFLFKRILKDGKDERFDDLKPNFLSFLIVWTLQGLWVTFTLAAALVVITTTVKIPLGTFAIVGFIIWLIGFVMEAVADAQKSKWRSNPKNKGKFIHTGLWSKSRHPNYFGEILIWIGVAIIALPVLQSWQFISLISPVFVTILLTRISGIPMLEKRADEKWGGTQEYEDYKKNTPVLIPKLSLAKTQKNH